MECRVESQAKTGPAGGNRTPNISGRSRMLYPVELRPDSCACCLDADREITSLLSLLLFKRKNKKELSEDRPFFILWSEYNNSNLGPLVQTRQ